MFADIEKQAEAHKKKVLQAERRFQKKVNELFLELAKQALNKNPNISISFHKCANGEDTFSNIYATNMKFEIRLRPYDWELERRGDFFDSNNSYMLFMKDSTKEINKFLKYLRTWKND